MEIETSSFFPRHKEVGFLCDLVKKSHNPLDSTGVGYGIPVLSHKKRPLETLDLINNILMRAGSELFQLYRSTPGGGLFAFFSSRKNPHPTPKLFLKAMSFFFGGGSKMAPNLSFTGVLDGYGMKSLFPRFS